MRIKLPTCNVAGYHICNVTDKNLSKRQPMPEENESQRISQKSYSRPAVHKETGEGVPLQSPAGKRRTRGRVYEYTPGTLWSHLLYGLGALAILVIPPMVPGVTGHGLIMGYMGMLVVLCGIICVWGIVRGLRSPVNRTATRR